MCYHHSLLSPPFYSLVKVLSINRLRYAATHCNSCYDHAVSFFCAGQLFSKSTAFGTRLHTATVATITLSPFFWGGGCFFGFFCGTATILRLTHARTRAHAHAYAGVHEGAQRIRQQESETKTVWEEQITRAAEDTGSSVRTARVAGQQLAVLRRHDDVALRVSIGHSARIFGSVECARRR